MRSAAAADAMHNHSRCLLLDVVAVAVRLLYKVNLDPMRSTCAAKPTDASGCCASTVGQNVEVRVRLKCL